MMLVFCSSWRREWEEGRKKQWTNVTKELFGAIYFSAFKLTVVASASFSTGFIDIARIAAVLVEIACQFRELLSQRQRNSGFRF